MVLRCLIVDDNAGFRAAAKSLLERGAIEVVGEAENATEARALVTELQPAVVLVDIDLGEENGFDLAQALAGEDHTKSILISTHSELDFADLIAASPAVGFISKSDLSADAVRELASSG